jgi:hypothetical protein
MSTSRPFAYNTGTTYPGTIQYGTIAVGIDPLNYVEGYGGLRWWNGPDEDLGYIICGPVPSNTQPTPNSGETASIQFWRSLLLTENSFKEIAQYVTGQSFGTGTEYADYLLANGYWTSYGFISPTPTLTFINFTGNAGLGTNYTYPNRSIGGPGLIVFTTHSEGSNNATLSGLTCNGIPATIHETEIIELSGNSITNSIASVRITSGSTTDIIASYTNQMDRMGIGIFRIENNLSDTPISFNSVSANSGTTLSMDLTGLTTNTNLGVVCETASDFNATITLYTGATRNYAARVTSSIGMIITGGNFTGTTAGSQNIFTDTPLSTQSMLLTGVVWN